MSTCYAAFSFSYLRNNCLQSYVTATSCNTTARTDCIYVFAHIKLPISLGHLMPWLETFLKSWLNDAHLQKFFWSSTMFTPINLLDLLTSLVWWFLQISIFLPLSEAYAWRWPDAEVSGALFQFSSFSVPTTPTLLLLTCGVFQISVVRLCSLYYNKTLLYSAVQKVEDHYQ